MSPRVLGAGTVALDTVETPRGRVDEAPGGSALYFGAAARLFGAVAIAGVAGQDYPSEPLDRLRSAGVDVSDVARGRGPSFRWRVRYDAAGARHTLSTNRAHALAEAPRLRHGAQVDVLFLGSTDPSVQRSVLDQAPGARLVLADTMAHWVRDRRAEVEELLSRVDVLLATEEELGLLGGDPDPLARVRSLGPAWIVVKDGARGARAHAAGTTLRVPAAPVEDVIDPTGAGDAFAGGLAGSLARDAAVARPDARTMARALGYAAVCGGIAVEAFSFDALLEVERPEVEARVKNVRAVGSE